MFGHTHYVSLLRLKPAELSALGHLPDIDRDMLTSSRFFDFIPSPLPSSSRAKIASDFHSNFHDSGDVTEEIRRHCLTSTNESRDFRRACLQQLAEN